MLSLKKSLNILKKTDALLEGHFVLSSGLHSSKYIQCAKLLSFPFLAEKICKSLANKIKKKHKNIDLILAPAMGGVVIGYEIGRLLKKETIFPYYLDNKIGNQLVNPNSMNLQKYLTVNYLIDKNLHTANTDFDELGWYTGVGIVGW